MKEPYICKFCDKNYGNICIDEHVATHCRTLTSKMIADVKDKYSRLKIVAKLRQVSQGK